MDWNRDGKIDASDLLVTELFVDELEKEVKKGYSANDCLENEEEHISHLKDV